MNIKTFICCSHEEGMRQVVDEFGIDAIILSCRIINNANNDCGNLIEIVAGLDEEFKNEKIDIFENEINYF